MRLRTFLAWLGAVACDDGYPLAPTPCDDFCHATQRANCPEDYPEGCVSQCEDDGVLRRFPECEPEWSARNDCYLKAPSTAFTCSEEVSVPRGELCLDQQHALLACLAPEAELCLEECIRRRTACGDDPGECGPRCTSHEPTCAAQERAYYLCALANAVDCSKPGEDTRPLEEIPCLSEIGAWFECL